MIITLDFETEPIERMPNYPPEPVGVALKYDDGTPKYLAWGHRNGINNCTRQDAAEELQKIATLTYKGAKLVMHNAKFDLAVLKQKLGIDINLKAVEDTMILAFLHNPYEENLSLKPLSEKYLNMPPEERDLMGEWLLANVTTEDGRKLSVSKGNDNYYVKYTAWAPVEIAGPYAIGDVERTYLLYRQFLAYIKQMGMEAAYAREISLIPILIENESSGVRVDVDRLSNDVSQYSTYISWLDDFIRFHLGSDINVDSDAELNKAMLHAGILDEGKLKLTKTGKYSMSRKNLVGAFKDSRWEELLSYRSVISTSLNTFMKPWSEVSNASNGFIYTSWNQVKGTGGGSRTGRFSSTPNFQNLVKPDRDTNKRPTHERLADAWDVKFWPIPKVRSYIVPYDKDWCLLGRDYSQQEIRICAHFGASPGPGMLLREFQNNPEFDLHQYVQDTLEYTYGIKLDRSSAKMINFSVTYGGGARRIGEALNIPQDEAREVRKAVLATNQDLSFLYDETSFRAREGIPIKTWGGRVYYVEPSREIDGRLVDFAYKMVNYLIQGSAADCTKQAWLNLGGNTERRKTYFTVHDEFLVSVPKEYAREEMLLLRYAMENVKFDLPMCSDGKMSLTNWSEMEKVDED